MRKVNVEELADGIGNGSRAAIARAITLVESTRPQHRAEAHELLKLIAPRTGRAFRVGISGVPGAGKSTFINAMGMKLIDERKHKVAVLAVDPSSSRTGGSILGDRTRMGELAQREDAFIRPSPSGGHLGGVARATREAIVEHVKILKANVELPCRVKVSGKVNTREKMQALGMEAEKYAAPAAWHVISVTVLSA